MLKPTTGIVAFQDEQEQETSGVYICRRDAEAYAQAITEILTVLEKNPRVSQQVGFTEMVALKNLAHLVGGANLVSRLELRYYSECLRSSRR